MTPSRGRARLGLLVPFTNTNLEPDMTLMSPPGISIHAARLGGYDAELIPDESQMHGLGASDIDEPLRLLMGVKPDIILYGCTSATLAHGPDFDRKLAARARSASGAETVTAAGALVSALQGAGCKKGRTCLALCSGNQRPGRRVPCRGRHRDRPAIRSHGAAQRTRNRAR